MTEVEEWHERIHICRLMSSEVKERGEARSMTVLHGPCTAPQMAGCWQLFQLTLGLFVACNYRNRIGLIFQC